MDTKNNLSVCKQRYHCYRHLLSAIDHLPLMSDIVDTFIWEHEHMLFPDQRRVFLGVRTMYVSNFFWRSLDRLVSIALTISGLIVLIIEMLFMRVTLR